MSYETTEESAWGVAMSAVEHGQMFACVPVIGPDGQLGIWTSVGTMPEPKNDLDVLAQVVVCIRRARDCAERSGLHPVG